MKKRKALFAHYHRSEQCLKCAVVAAALYYYKSGVRQYVDVVLFDLAVSL
jgi:hypothetical protein